MKKQKIVFSLLAIVTSTAFSDQAWTIDTQEDWAQSISSKNQIDLKDGMVSPTAKLATLKSELKQYSEQRSAASITFEQSPVWLNWEPTKNIGTASMQDAPVMLTMGPDNYWMFAKYGRPRSGKKGEKSSPFKSKPAILEGFDIPLLTTQVPNEFTAPGGLKRSAGGYHAWQSRDMVNWVHHGSVTERFSSWVTTAEYVDGKAYIYYDFPNDQDPHLYIDEDLTDGIPGKNMGMAFKDPSHGSDCSFIRDLEGNFHVIYEDWSPIDASRHAWDSPLAGHAISADGIGDFKILSPAVDERTKPTGKIAEYAHPHWHAADPENYPGRTATVNVPKHRIKAGETRAFAEYEIHKPEQDAYGDWASIAIGGQYYLFADFDPASAHGKTAMSVAMFTSSSLDEPFTFFNNVGKGHPDPDVCFAEGRFYLATQQDSDFTSPGPWVESVEVRVGVDIYNDAKIDQWTDWQAVKESYDYTPGFAKQIKKVPASIDLSGLPKGYGFQFEVRMTDTTENKSKPVLDKVVLSFAN